jgi:hypothetical protein
MQIDKYMWKCMADKLYTYLLQYHELHVESK